MILSACIAGARPSDVGRPSHGFLCDDYDYYHYYHYHY